MNSYTGTCIAWKMVGSNLLQQEVFFFFSRLEILFFGTTKFSQDILAQDCFYLKKLVFERCTLVQCHDVLWKCIRATRLMM